VRGFKAELGARLTSASSSVPPRMGCGVRDDTSRVAASTGTAARRRATTTSRWPLEAARCSDVQPSCTMCPPNRLQLNALLSGLHGGVDMSQGVPLCQVSLADAARNPSPKNERLLPRLLPRRPVPPEFRPEVGRCRRLPAAVPVVTVAPQCQIRQPHGFGHGEERQRHAPDSSPPVRRNRIWTSASVRPSSRLPVCARPRCLQGPQSAATRVLAPRPILSGPRPCRTLTDEGDLS
jgi:hypothetical protein